MIEEHLAHMLRNRADRYNQREVFRFKREGHYENITWIDFKHQSEMIAYYLISKSIEIQENVGIFSANCPQWTITDLAILSCRSVVVPIYSTSTIEQLRYIVDETEMKVLFVDEQEQLDKAIPLLDEENSLNHIVTFNCQNIDDHRIVSFNDLITSAFDESIKTDLEDRLANARSVDLATIIYTSGTTGEPKGVMLDHNNFMASFKIHSKRLPLTKHDVSLCFLPLSHIFERAWTFFLLYSGGTNVYNQYPKKVVEELAMVKPTVLCVVPRFFEKVHAEIISTSNSWKKTQKQIFDWAVAVGHEYIEYQKDNKQAPLPLLIKRFIADKLVYRKIRKIFGGHIRFIPCSGSAMTPELRRFFHAVGIFVNYGYGATETLATVSCMRHDQYDFDYTGDIMPEVEVMLSPENMILVKGQTVFKGYYKKPEETKEVLKDGWYFTGDLGELIGDKKLIMIERMKDIIKTSTGKFISPQKIELILSRSELIEQMCVIGDNRQYITALIVPAHERLLKWLKSKGEDISDINSIAHNTEIQQWFQDMLASIQSELPTHERVVKFALLEEPFTIENGLLTNSMKVKRKQVNQRYKEIIDSLY